MREGQNITRKIIYWSLSDKRYMTSQDILFPVTVGVQSVNTFIHKGGFSVSPSCNLYENFRDQTPRHFFL